jgi:hypothetical protein
VKTYLLALILLLSAFQASSEEAEQILHKEFVPTAFGIKSRTIDSKDGDAVIKAIENFRVQNPGVEIARIELQTCTSDYELPQNTIVNRKVDEHVKLAEERHAMVTGQLLKDKRFPVAGKSKLCGPTFEPKDLNDRFVTKESGVIYEQKFNQLLNDSDFVTQLKEEALIEDPQTLKSKYPSPFLAKFKPFQGIRIFIVGKHKKKESSEEKSRVQPSGKSQ